MLKKYFLMLLALSLIVALIYKRVAADGQPYKGKAKTTGSGTGGGDRDFSGESLYTGDVAFSAPITEIGGVAVALAYNSNVHKLVRADNAVLQAGWVGLGWTLNLGSNTADINNTRDVSDDRYFYIAATGSSELLLQSGNSFRLKDYQYWLITRHLDVSGNIIGWTIIREDGTTYRYGNYDKNSGNFNLNFSGTYATRLSLCWGNLITNPVATSLSSGTLVAYQWDLSDIQDIVGKHTTIEYQQEEDFLSILSYQSLHYTRASYPYRIIDHTGRSVQFVLGALPSNEYPVPPDQRIQRFFQSKFLDEIWVKDKSGVVTQKYDLDYIVADVLSLGRNKRYLTSGWSGAVNLVNRPYNSNIPNSLTQPGTDFVADVISPLNDNGWSHALKQGYALNFDIIFQGTPGDYPVTYKTIKDAMGTSYTSTFLYEDGVYDADLNFAKYNKVTVIPAPGNIGKTVTYFYNDLDESETEEFVNVANYQELDGIPYKVEVYNSVNNTTPVKEETNTWSVYVVDATQGIYHRRLSSTATTLDGITTTVSYDYNNSNGLVSKVTEHGQNGDRVTETAYAFQQPAYNGANGMDDKNMLLQVYSTTVSELTTAMTYFAKNWTT